MITLAQYYDKLARHDWFYEYSDDNSVWRRGSESADEIRRIAEYTPEHQALYMAWRDHVFSGKPWDTEKAPKPERPKE